MFEIFKIGFLQITFLDLLDLVLLFVIFYWMYNLLKDTVAVQILFGLVLLIFMTFISEMINLRAINWLLKSVMGVWLLAFIILFQPELRRVLLRLSNLPFLRFFLRTNLTQTIDEVISAVKEMSENHIGGLIVFVRSQNVEMNVDTGVPIGARVSKELLLSIFNPKSPLHDGAVLIEGSNLLFAKCILPLSTVTKLEGRLLGTRHRAALGLSEQTDALVLVVSEETGWISIAESGTFIFNIPKNKIESILSEKLS
ncbi:TIGR00159 family protein [Bacteroidetes/Chlorobi group bacterium MS-B_bin-24]|jgi:diadenylate cyclase|nr:MAG: TIGR00159 family protein [Bacteroidetes/Chlorobi group bacterium MS-B_bin-24]